MRYAKVGEFFSCPGKPERILYAPKVDKDGCIELVEAGKENILEKVNSFAESTDIRLIMARAAQGDMSGFNQNPGMYGDFTSVPQTYAEFLQLQIDSRNLFNKLPQEIKDKFGNDPEQFMSQSGTEDWQKKLGDVLPPEYRWIDPNVGKEEEMKEVEVKAE